MTVRDLGAEYAFDDPDDGWFGAEQPSDDAPAPPAPPPPRRDVPATLEDDSTADTDRWFVADMGVVEPVEAEQPAHRLPAPESVAASINVVPTRRNGFVRASAPGSYESRITNSGAWEFKSTPTSRPGLRPRTVMVAAALLLGVAAVVGVVLILRSPAGDQPAPVAPSESAAPSAPSTSAPAVPVAPLPPPVLPPPPPPAEEITPPVATRQYSPSYDTPDTAKKPQQNVTRAPLSATPPPPPRQTDRGRATPGRSGSHGIFG